VTLKTVGNCTITQIYDRASGDKNRSAHFAAFGKGWCHLEHSGGLALGTQVNKKLHCRGFAHVAYVALWGSSRQSGLGELWSVDLAYRLSSGGTYASVYCCVAAGVPELGAFITSHMISP